MAAELFSERVQENVGYTTYSALLTQTGGTDPVVTELFNTTGATITWTNNVFGPGLFDCTASAAIFNANKVSVYCQQMQSTGATTGVSLINLVFLESSATVKVFGSFPTDGSGASILTSSTPTADILQFTAIEMRIYP